MFERHRVITLPSPQPDAFVPLRPGRLPYFPDPPSVH